MSIAACGRRSRVRRQAAPTPIPQLLVAPLCKSARGWAACSSRVLLSKGLPLLQGLHEIHEVLTVGSFEDDEDIKAYVG